MLCMEGFGLKKLLFYGLAGPEDIDFHLLFGNSQDAGNLLILLSLEVAQLDAAALFFGQAVDDTAHYLHAVLVDGLFKGVRRCHRLSHIVGVEALVVVFPPLGVVEGKITADGHGESLYVVDIVPRVALAPHLDHRFLHDILGISPVEGDAQGQPEELILQRQHIVAETDILHYRCLIIAVAVVPARIIVYI